MSKFWYKVMLMYYFRLRHSKLILKLRERTVQELMVYLMDLKTKLQLA